MAIRNVRVVEDDILKKECREVKEITERVNILLDDMLETMYATNGVGLAGPQVGILKRLCVIDVDDGNVYKMINPIIIERNGECVDIEGCLSIPNVNEYVIRPESVVARYFDENGDEIEIEAYDLLARCICHELDHLDGVLFTDRAKEADKAKVEELLEKQKQLEEEYCDEDFEDDLEIIEE